MGAALSTRSLNSWLIWTAESVEEGKRDADIGLQFFTLRSLLSALYSDFLHLVLYHLYVIGTITAKYQLLAPIPGNMTPRHAVSSRTTAYCLFLPATSSLGQKLRWQKASRTQLQGAWATRRHISEIPALGNLTASAGPFPL